MNINTRKNIYIITVIIICLVVTFNTELTKGDDMPRGYNDWGIDVNQLSFYEIDYGELPARLGYLDMLSRSGKVIRFLNGEGLSREVGKAFTSADGIADVSRKITFNGQPTLLIRTPTVSTFTSVIRTNIVYPDTNTVSITFYYHLDGLVSTVNLLNDIYLGETREAFRVRVDAVNETVSVSDSAGSFQVVSNNAQWINTAIPHFRHIKVVFNIDKSRYDVIDIDGVRTDISSISGISAADTGVRRIDTTLSVVGINATQKDVYIGGIIWCVDEPLLNP